MKLAFARIAALTITVFGLSAAASAHNLWLLPSSTTVSAPQWITVDAAVSNDLFYFNHNALALDGLSISAPDGNTLQPENVARGKLRNSFDVNLAQPGTYRLAVTCSGVMASWTENGQRKRWGGEPAAFEKSVPADATELQVNQSVGRIETFVTVGKPSTDVFKPSGVGLELVPVTHPNDLVVGEPARFQFLIDGKPAAGLDVELIPGNSRYRDKLDERKYTTDAEGRVSLAFDAPGMYWLSASAKDDKVAIKQAKERRLSYAATIEVMAP